MLPNQFVIHAVTIDIVQLSPTLVFFLLELD